MGYDYQLYRRITPVTSVFVGIGGNKRIHIERLQSSYKKLQEIITNRYPRLSLSCGWKVTLMITNYDSSVGGGTVNTVSRTTLSYFVLTSAANKKDNNRYVLAHINNGEIKLLKFFSGRIPKYDAIRATIIDRVSHLWGANTQKYFSKKPVCPEAMTNEFSR